MTASPNLVSASPHRRLWVAAAVGGLATLAESTIAFATLSSGYGFGWYDVVGTALGLLALAAVWSWPAVAAALWLSTLQFLYNGKLLISIVSLPVLLLPPTAAGLALWSWRQQR